MFAPTEPERKCWVEM